MKSNKRLLLSLGLVAALAALFFGFERYSATHDTAIVEYERREMAKEFNLPVIGKSPHYPTDAMLSLTTARKTPVLVHFWASWCAVCREEKPGLDEYWAKHKDAGILVLGIASFDTKEAMDASKMIAEPTFTVLLDQEGDVANAYKVSALPVSFLIGVDGAIVKKFVGILRPYDYNAIDNYLDSLKKAH